MNEATTAPAPATETPSHAPAETKPAAKDDDKEPSWLAARLERERKSVLKGLGVESVDDAKSAIDELKKRQAAEKTENERLRGEVESLKARDLRAKELEAVVALRATSELASLTAAQREAVMRLAGEDPGKQLTAVETLRGTWAQAAQPVAAAPIAAPASTSPNAPAPKPTAPEAENKLATWESLQKSNPMQAAHYLVAHQLEISAARQARK